MCIYILESYPWHHSAPESFICCCSGRDSCMLPSQCMLPSLRSAPSSKLTPLYVPVSPVARSATCKPCPVALVPDSTVGCSRPPARNLDLSSREQAQGPWIGFIYILYDTLFAQYRRSPLAELGTAPVHSPARHRAAVWVGRGATPTPREAEWSSRVAPVFWGCYNQNIFKDRTSLLVLLL